MLADILREKDLNNSTFSQDSERVENNLDFAFIHRLIVYSIS